MPPRRNPADVHVDDCELQLPITNIGTDTALHAVVVPGFPIDHQFIHYMHLELAVLALTLGIEHPRVPNKSCRYITESQIFRSQTVV